MGRRESRSAPTRLQGGGRGETSERSPGSDRKASGALCVEPGPERAGFGGSAPAGGGGSTRPAEVRRALTVLTTLGACIQAESCGSRPPRPKEPLEIRLELLFDADQEGEASHRVAVAR